MSEQELAHLVEKIVLRVMAKIEADDQLASLVKDENNDKSKWARTCSTFRSTENSVKSSVPSTPPTVVENKVQVSSKKLYTERDILELVKAGQTTLVISQKTILTPSAKDAAKAKGIEIKVEN